MYILEYNAGIITRWQEISRDNDLQFLQDVKSGLIEYSNRDPKKLRIIQVIEERN